MTAELISADKERLKDELARAVPDKDEEKAASLAEEYIKSGFPAEEGIMDGLMRGMNMVADLYESGEYFLTDLLFCSDALYAGLNIMRPHLPRINTHKHKAVMGVAAGDIHDIGKTLVITMLEVYGFEVIDLGVDVPPERFVEAAVSEDVEIIGISTFLPVTLDNVGKVIQLLEEKVLRDKYTIMIGGSAASQKVADSIHADIFTENAVEAARAAAQAVGIL